MWGGRVMAQELTTTAAQEFMDNLSNQQYFQTEVEFDNRFKGVQGNPYLFEDWQGGQVILNDGKSFNGELKYDMYEDILIYGKNKKGYTVKSDKVSSFTLKELFFVFRTDHGYLQRLNEGKVLLLAKRSKRLRKASLATAYSTNQDYHQFIEEVEYLLELEGTNADKCPKNVGGFVKIFPQHKNEIKSFARQHRLFLQRESDLIEMVKYCNQLMN